MLSEHFSQSHSFHSVSITECIEILGNVQCANELPLLHGQESIYYIKGSTLNYWSSITLLVIRDLFAGKLLAIY